MKATENRHKGNRGLPNRHTLTLILALIGGSRKRHNAQKKQLVIAEKQAEKAIAKSKAELARVLKKMPSGPRPLSLNLTLTLPLCLLEGTTDGRGS